ncbi:MAG: DUF1653 domain-containing protein, partial [Lachnospiraceae bacterium]|nr:DUF1653 domain-containing protein [Lachnospiraceae bacterium]
MRENPKPMQRYRHFKGNLYQVLALAKDSETMQEVVVYQALYDDYQIYVRSLEMFMSRVDTEKYPDAAQEFRFEPVTAGNAPESGQTAPESTGTEVMAGREENTDVREMNPAAVLRKELPKAGQEENTGAREKSADEHIANERNQGNPQQQADDEFQIDSAVLEFLDADTYGQKLNILASLKHRITDDMITTMAVA